MAVMTRPPSAPPSGGDRRVQLPEGGIVGAIVTFLRDVRSELRKVTWPTWDDVRNLTIIVIAVSMMVGVALGAIDAVFEQLFRVILQRP